MKGRQKDLKRELSWSLNAIWKHSNFIEELVLQPSVSRSLEILESHEYCVLSYDW